MKQTTQTQRAEHPLIAHIFLTNNERLHANLKPATSPELVNQLYALMEAGGVIAKYAADHPGLKFL